MIPPSGRSRDHARPTLRRFAVSSTRRGRTGDAHAQASVRSSVLVRCAPLPDRRARDPPRLQHRLARLRRTAAEQRARDRERARHPGPLHPVVRAAGVRSALAADHRPVAQPAAARRRGLAACARRRHRHRLEVRLPHRRQAHLESRRLRHRGAAVRVGRRLDFARRLGLDRVVRGAGRLLRHPGAAGRAPLRHRDLLPRQPRRAAVRPRLVARRPAGDPAASAAERSAADLHVLHDLRSAHLAGFAARPLHLRRLGRRSPRTT